MSLSALPNEIIHAIADYLDLRSVVRLSNACRPLSSSHVIVNHRHGRLYLAIRRYDFPVVKGEMHKLVDAAFKHLTRSQPTENVKVRLYLEVHSVLLALTWEMVVARDSTDREWWLEWSLLAQELRPAAEFPKPEDVASTSTPIMRMLTCAVERRHLAAIKVFCKETTAKNVDHRWPDPENLFGPTLESIFANSQGLLWSAADRANLLAYLTSATTASLSADPGTPFEDTIARTNQVGCLLEFVVMCDRMDRRSVLSLTDLLGACASRGNQDLFDLIITSYIGSVGVLAPSSDKLLPIRFRVPHSPQSLIRQLEECYFRRFGVAKSSVRPFLEILARTSCEEVFIPYMLGTAHRRTWNKFTPMELEWLLSHVRIHPAMLHALAFNSSSTCKHTPQTIQILLDRLPIDLFAIHELDWYMDSPLDSVDLHCTRRRLRESAIAQEQGDLPSFTTGLWFVSYGPVPEPERAAHNRLASTLLSQPRARTPHATGARAITNTDTDTDANADADADSDSDSDSNADVDTDAAAAANTDSDDELASEASKSKPIYCDLPWLAFVAAKHVDISGVDAPLHARTGTLIRWHDPARQINKLDLPSALFAYLYEFRLDAALGVVELMAGEAAAAAALAGVEGSKVYALTMSTFPMLQEMVSEVDSVQLPMDERERRIVGFARVVLSLDEFGLADAQVSSNGEYVEFLEWARDGFGPKVVGNVVPGAA